jgi:hypothetical protein
MRPIPNPPANATVVASIMAAAERRLVERDFTIEFMAKPPWGTFADEG